MNPEQEVRAAAIRLNQDGDESTSSWIDYRESSQRDEDVKLVSEWVLKELDHRAAMTLIPNEIEPEPKRKLVVGDTIKFQGCNALVMELGTLQVELGINGSRVVVPYDDPRLL